MNRNKELLKNTFILTVGIFCTKLLSFFLLPFYTKYLTTSEYGIVDLLHTLITLLTPFIGFEIGQGIFKFLVQNRNDELKKREYITSTLYFSLISLLISSFIYIIVGLFINNEYKYFLLFGIIFSYINSLFLQISRGLGDNKTYSEGGFVTAFFTIIFNIIFLIFLGYKSKGVLLANILGYIFGLLFVFIKIKIYRFIRIKNYNRKRLKELLKYSLPLVPNSISWWIFSASDRVVVSSFLGLSFNGILAVSYKFSNVFIIIYDIFNKGWTEQFIIHINDEDIESYFNKVLNIVFNIFTAFAILIISFLPLCFKILVKSNYDSAYNLIPISIAACIFQMLMAFISVVYVANNDSKTIAKSSAWSAFINIVTHLLLIKFIGIYAAVVSTLVSYFSFFLIRVFDINKRYLKIKFNIKNVLLLLIGFILSSIVYYSKNKTYIYAGMILSIMLFIFINFNLIKESKKIFIYLSKRVRKGATK